MYRLHGERSPNVYKVALFLEEARLEWEPVWLDVSGGAQFSPEFTALSPNGRIPILTDLAPVGGGEPFVIWESGAILTYLAEKTGLFLSSNPRRRNEAIMWLFWQMAGLGPMSGQNAHFIQYEELIPDNQYAKNRYKKENGRLLEVLSSHLSDREFISDAYGIADMACFPWVRLHAFLQQDVSHLPALSRWLAAIEARPATSRAYQLIDSLPHSKSSKSERFRIMCTREEQRASSG